MIWLLYFLMLSEFQEYLTTLGNTEYYLAGRVYQVAIIFSLISLEFNPFLIMVISAMIHPKHD